jgi:5-methylcytosine-specific restriction endonuclease McrBC regulatory subunit McrC
MLTDIDDKIEVPNFITDP